jgi:hypothetical protein
LVKFSVIFWLICLERNIVDLSTWVMDHQKIWRYLCWWIRQRQIVSRLYKRWQFFWNGYATLIQTIAVFGGTIMSAVIRPCWNEEVLLWWDVTVDTMTAITPAVLARQYQFWCMKDTSDGAALAWHVPTDATVDVMFRGGVLFRCSL